MTLEELVELLDKTPVIADIHPLSLLYMPADVTVIPAAVDVAMKLDAPTTVWPGRWLLTDDDPAFRHRFPRVRVAHDPFTPALNSVLFEHFEAMAQTMLCQSQLAAVISRAAAECDAIILMLIDGLSYENARQWCGQHAPLWSLEPCLVDVPTITSIAFPNAIGAPSVAERLFDRGFHRRIGFTYWTREDNELTNLLFRSLPEMHKTGNFDDIVSGARRVVMESATLGKPFIQIVRTGLDGYAHKQKRTPPVAAIVDEIFQEFSQLVAISQEAQRVNGCRTGLFLTAIHGILWQTEFESQVVGRAPSGASARYCRWADLFQQDETGMRFVVGHEEYYCLNYPKVRRPLRIDEQGVHGGVSFQESVVPFIAVRV